MTVVAHPVVHLRAGHIHWRIAADRVEQVQAWILEHFINALEDESALMKQGGGSRVGAAGGLVVKETMARTGRSVLRFGLRRSGSRRAFRNGWALLACGIPTPCPLAWATVRYCGLRARDYLVTEEVTGSRRLTEILETETHSTTQMQLLDRLGALAAQFHVNGFSNRDLKDSNILVSGDGELRLTVIDLEGVRKRARISTQRARRDLWAMVRSMKIFGWDSPDTQARLLAAYNREVPAGLQLDALPQAGAGVVAKESL